MDLPLLQPTDGFALHRQLDVGVRCVDSRSCGMAHERHANFLHDAGLHQASVKGVAEVVETHVTDSGIPQRRLPGALDDADRLPAEADDEALWLALLKQKLMEPTGQGYLA